MEISGLIILYFLLITLFSTQIASQLALGNTTIQHLESLDLVQESHVYSAGLASNMNGESMKQYNVSLAKGQRGGRGSGGGIINHNPHRSDALTKTPRLMTIFIMGATFYIIRFMMS